VRNIVGGLVSRAPRRDGQDERQQSKQRPDGQYPQQHAHHDCQVGPGQEADINQAAFPPPDQDGEMPPVNRVVGFYVWELVEQQQIADQEEGRQ
jgi:hypothetical protein